MTDGLVEDKRPTVTTAGSLPNGYAAEPLTVPLAAVFVELLADLRRDALAIEARAQGALMLYLRQHGLEGAWRIAENGRELVKQQ